MWKEYRATLRFLVQQLSFISFPPLDYLPVDAPRNVGGSVHARVVSRALEVRIDSLGLSTAQFPRYSMHMMTSPSLK